MTSIGARLAVGMVRQYRRLPRLRPPVCRFDPTCSRYAIGAIEEYGLFKGVFLGAQRVGRCHPWGGVGFDPVPSRKGSPD